MLIEPCGLWFPNLRLFSGRAVVSAGLEGFVGQVSGKAKRAGGVPTLLISMPCGVFTLLTGVRIFLIEANGKLA